MIKEKKIKKEECNEGSALKLPRFTLWFSKRVITLKKSNTYWYHSPAKSHTPLGVAPQHCPYPVYEQKHIKFNMRHIYIQYRKTNLIC